MITTACTEDNCLLRKKAWNPYLAGAGLGVLSWAVFAVADNPLGVTTALSQASGAACVPFVGADAVASNPYWAKTAPKWDYGTLFLVGTVLGALVSSLLGRTWRVETVPAVWRERFGPSAPKRLLFAFVGGVVAMYGARMAALRGDAADYRANVGAARRWLEEMFDLRDLSVSSLQKDLQVLEQVNIAPALPDISRSLQLLERVTPRLSGGS